MNRQLCLRWLVLFSAIMSVVVLAEGKDKQKQFVVERVYDYSATIDSVVEGITSFTYLKYQMAATHYNNIIYCVPRLYNIPRSGKRIFYGEHFMHETFHEGEEEDKWMNIAHISTMRRRRTLLPNLRSYLAPHIYSPAIIDGNILSPFNRLNHRLYKYNVIYVSDSIAQVEFTPQVNNTQAITGQAKVETETGKILSCYLEGEFDMVRFKLNMEMGDEGVRSLLPKRSKLYTRFTFLDNIIETDYEGTFFLPDSPDYKVIDDEEGEREFVERHRPYPLTPLEAGLLAEYDSVQAVRRNAPPSVRKKNFTKDVLWDIFGEHLFHRIRGRFGPEDRGYFRLSPILNPLYFSYTGRRGFTYRLSANISYTLSPNSEILIRQKMGYSFKWHRFYVEAPVTYTFDKAHEGNIKVTFKDGNQITNSTVIDILKEEKGDTIDWDNLDLEYFKHQQLDFTMHYNITPFLGLEAGILKNRWMAVSSDGFIITGKPQVYESTSFHTEAKVLPLGKQGPVFTVDYERSINGLSKDKMNYERWEFDFSYLKKLSCIRSVSLRVGGGFYTTHTTGVYFLDYTNFRENNIPGGWNDDWSGEFELLDRNYYNASKYYLRMNATYESPFLLMSWIPVIGHTIEKERFYISGLRANKLSHYAEIGYSFTNRFVSLGCFMALKRGRYNGMGVRVGFELFNGW